MKQWIVTVYTPAGSVTVYPAGDTPKDAVRSQWEFARLHSVDHTRNMTVWSTPEGLASCEYLGELDDPKGS